MDRLLVSDLRCLPIVLIRLLVMDASFPFLKQGCITVNNDVRAET